MASLEQLNTLINLARADGEVTEEEKQYIIRIGLANHLLVTEILPMFTEDQPVTLPISLTAEEKFEWMFSLVQLMKIDEKLYQAEIKYCSFIASRLGYQQDVIFDLMLSVKNAAMRNDEMESLRKHTADYLKIS